MGFVHFLSRNDGGALRCRLGAVLLFPLLLLPVLGGNAREWDRAGAVRAFDVATKLNGALHAEPLASRTPQLYLQVIQKYQEVLLKDPHYGACDDSLYLAGKLYQEMGERFQQPRYYQQSVDTYFRLVEQYPKTTFGPDALMAAADILINQLNKPESAAPLLQRVVTLYPGTSQAKSAQALLAKLPKDPVPAGETKPPAGKETVALSGTPSQAKTPEVRTVIVPVQADPVAPRAAGSAAVTTADKIRTNSTAQLPPPRPAQLPGSGERTLTRMLGLKAGSIVIDPGHGGHDTGTLADSGMKEKDLSLDLALRLRALLQARLGVEVILTRETDVFVSLEERTHIANRHKADLFVSIHANHSQSPRVSGVETFVLNFARSAYERDLAARENAAAHHTISDLEDIVRTITRQEKLAESRELARLIQKNLQAEMSRQNPSSRNRGIKQAPFVVLAGASMPSVLTEVAFLSNPKDSAALAKDKPRGAAAEALFKGISDYVQTLSSEASLRHGAAR